MDHYFDEMWVTVVVDMLGLVQDIVVLMGTEDYDLPLMFHMILHSDVLGVSLGFEQTKVGLWGIAVLGDTAALKDIVNLMHIL